MYKEQVVVTHWQQTKSRNRDNSNKLMLPIVLHRSLLPPTNRVRAGLHSNPLAVVAGSTFLEADLHSILRAVDRQPSLGCRVVADIRIVLVDHIDRHRRLVVDMGRFGLEVAVTQGPSSRTQHYRNGPAVGR